MVSHIIEETIFPGTWMNLVESFFFFLFYGACKVYSRVREIVYNPMTTFLDIDDLLSRIETTFAF